MNTIYGYWRCSTDAQDQVRQIRALKDAGSEVIVGDKITGTSNYGDREALSKLLDDIKEGDLLILDELNRLGRTMVTMLVEVQAIDHRDNLGIHCHVIAVAFVFGRVNFAFVL